MGGGGGQVTRRDDAGNGGTLQGERGRGRRSRSGRGGRKGSGPTAIMRSTSARTDSDSFPARQARDPPATGAGIDGTDTVGSYGTLVTPRFGHDLLGNDGVASRSSSSSSRARANAHANATPTAAIEYACKRCGSNERWNPGSHHSTHRTRKHCCSHPLPSRRKRSSIRLPQSRSCCDSKYCV